MKKLLCVFGLAALVACNGCKDKDKEHPDQPDPNAPKIMSYSIIHAYPHDTSSYTQGLLIYKGDMYEGTGNYGFSKLKKVDLQTGKASQ